MTVDSDEEKYVLSANVGRLGSKETLQHDDNQGVSLMRQQELHRWQEVLSDYQDFLRATHSLESRYLELISVRRCYFSIAGSIIWLTISLLFLAIPLALPHGWNSVSKACGWIVLALSTESAVFSTIPMVISCWIGRQKKLPNPLYFLPFHAEAAVLSLLLMVASGLILVHGYHPNRNGPAFGCFIVLLVLCGLITARIILLKTSDPIAYISLTTLFVLSLIGYYLALEGFFREAQWWISFWGPSAFLALFCVVAAIQFVRIGIRCFQEPSGTLLPWGFGFRHRFVAGVEGGPFLVSVSEEVERLLATHSVNKVEPLEIGSRQLSAQLLARGREMDHEEPKQSLARIQRCRRHLRLLNALRSGYFLGAVGWILLAVGICFGGLYISRHYDIATETFSTGGTLQEAGKRVSAQDFNAVVRIDASKKETHPDETLSVTTKRKRINKHRKRRTEKQDQSPIIPDAYPISNSPSKEDGIQLEKNTQLPTIEADGAHNPYIQFSGDEEQLINEKMLSNKLSLAKEEAIKKQFHIVHNQGDGEYHAVAREQSFPSNALTSSMEPAPREDRQSLEVPTQLSPSQSKTEASGQKTEAGGVFYDFVMTENLVGSGASWWIWVVSIILGILLLSQTMINTFGSWTEYLAFAFLDTTNRNTSIDLRFPEEDLTNAQLLDHEVTLRAKAALKSLKENSFDIFMNPQFEGCALPPLTERKENGAIPKG